ncbi:MAG: hypothetical protein OEW00_14900 [candidate division Zixibacteria bacterium]|nr:hypothetical protein [candidate division Zixibacteria bacterium]
MRSGSLYRACATLAVLLAIVGGCSEKPPSRDHIPALRNVLYRLQVAVREQNRAAIDSLLSNQAVSTRQSSDSLLTFIYFFGDKYFPFERFGDYDIAYTEDRARIDCYIMDSTGRADRPVTFTFALEHDLWLLKQFEVRRDRIVDTAQ